MARTNNLTNFLTDVATAIKTKKGDNTPIPASNFDTEITNLPSGGGNNANIDGTKYITGTRVSSTLTTIPAIDISSLSVNSMSYMFAECQELETINVTNSSKVKNMNYVFYKCYKLRNVPTTLDTSNVTSMTYMFSYCSLIETIPNNINMSKVANATAMFGNCSSLENVPVFDWSSLASTSSNINMFNGCTNLTNQSLDNILQSCVTATKISTKTLSQMGFSSENYPASTIQALPHYQDFINAGWTIGY